MPICLPGSDQFPDEKGEVHVAGWGSDTDDHCTTGKYGPDPYTECTNFDYQDTIFNECSFLPPPVSTDNKKSDKNNICLALRRKMKPTTFPELGYTQTDIFDEKDKLLTTCFDFPNFTSGPYGWCATCQRGAKPGQPGYCGMDTITANNVKELGKPTATTGWGYCEKQCHPSYKKRTSDQNMLQEVDLQILRLEDCEKMGQYLKVITDIELCAAKQVCYIIIAFLYIKSKIFKNSLSLKI